MATEADIPGPASLSEKGVKNLTPGEFNQPPETADYFIKSGNIEAKSNIETLDSGFKGNTGMTVGESFFESPSITKVSGEETSGKQADDIPHQAEKEMAENEKQILEDENSKTAEETGSKENEHLGETEEISEEGSNEISDSTEIRLKKEKVQELCLKVGEEEISREEKMSHHIEAYSSKEKPKIIEKETSDLGSDEEDKDAELTTSKETMILEGGSGQNGAALIHTPELTVHNMDTNIETSIHAYLKIENKYKVSSTEVSPIEENNEQKNSVVVDKNEANNSSFLDEEKGPDVNKTIEKIESEKEGIGGDANKQACAMFATSIDIQNDREENSAIPENVNKLDNPSVSSMQEAGDKVGCKLEYTSITASKEESQDTINLNENMQDVTLFMNETQKNHADIPSVTDTEEKHLQTVGKTEISKAVIGTWSEDVVERSPQERGYVEILDKTAQADSSESAKVKDEGTPEQKLDSSNVIHEEGKQNIAEELAVTEASAGESNDNDGHTNVASERIINDVVTAAEHSIGELRNEKIKTSMEMVSEETSATASSDCSETVTCTKDDRSTENNEECFHKKEKEKTIVIDTSSDDAIPREENLPPTEPTEKIEIEEVEIPNKDVDELNATHSLEQGTVLVKGAELQEVSGFEPQDQVAEKEKSADIAAIKDDGYAIKENLPSTELNEKIQIDKIVTQNKNGDELNVTHSLKPEITLLQPEELPEVSFFEPKNQVNEAEKLVGINAVEDDGISKNLQPTESTEKIEIPEVKIPNKIVDELNAIDSLEQEAVLAQGEVSREVTNFEPQNEVNGKKSIDVDAIKDDWISKEKNLPPMEQYEKIETVEIEQNKKVDNLNAIHSFERETEIVQHEELREISNLEPQSQIKEEEKLIDIDATKDNGIQKSLPPTELSEKIQISEVQFPNKNVDEFNAMHSSEQEMELAEGEVLQEVSDFESQEQVNEEEESVDIDAVRDDGIPRDENLPPTEQIGSGKVEIEDNFLDALNATPSLEQDKKLVQGEELQEVSSLEPQDQVNEEQKLNLPPIAPSEIIHISKVEIPNKNVDELNVTHLLEQETVLAQDEELQEVPDFEPEVQFNKEEKSEDIDIVKDDGIPKDENLASAAQNKKIETAKAEIQDKSIEELNATPSLEQETELVQGEESREVSNLEHQDQIKEEEKLVSSNVIEDNEIPMNQPSTEPRDNIHISEVEIPNKNVDELNATPSWEQETVQTQGEVLREISDFEPQGQVKEEEKSLNICAVKDDEIPKEENLSTAEPNEKIGTVEARIQDKNVVELNGTSSLEQDAKLVQGEELPEVSNLEPQDQANEEEKLNLPPMEPNENIHISEVEVQNKNLNELNVTNSLEQEMVPAQGEALREVSDFAPQEQVQEEEKTLHIDAITDDGCAKENLSPAEPNEKIRRTETEIQDKNVAELNATPLLEQDPKLVQGEDLQEVLNLEPQDQVKEEEKTVDTNAIKEDGTPKIENLPLTELSEDINVSEDIPNKNVDKLNVIHSWEQETVQAQAEVSQEVSDFEPQGQVKEEENSLNIDVSKDYEIPKEENLTPTKPSEEPEIAEVETPNKNVDELNVTYTLEQETILAKGKVLQEISDFEPQDQVHEKEISVDIDAVQEDGTPKEENLPPAELNEKIKVAQIEVQNKNTDESNAHSLKQETALMQGEELQEVSNREPQDQVIEEEKLVDIDVIKDNGIQKVENLSPIEPSENTEIVAVEIPNKYVDELHVAHPLEPKMELAQGEVMQEVSEFETQEQVNEEKSIDIDIVKKDGIPKEENHPPISSKEMIEIQKVEIHNNIDELNVAQLLEQETILVQGEELQEAPNFEPQDQVNEEDKSVHTDPIKDDGILRLENLPPIEPNDKIQVAEVEIPNRNADELNVSQLLEQEPVLTQVEVLQEVFDFEPQDQVNEANAATRDGEKYYQNNSEACESSENNSELPLAKREVITELSLETSETEIEKVEKVHKSDSKAKVEKKEVEMSREESIQKEEACETEMHKLETSYADKVCSEAFLHETVEQNFEAASLQKEETTFKDGEDDEKITCIVNEEATSIIEVSDKQNIQDRVEHLSTEVINEETTGSFRQIEKDVEISEGEDIKGPITEEESISQKTVEEGLVKNSQDEEKDINPCNSREITSETVNSTANAAKQNDENPNSILQCSLVKEQENLQSEASLAEETYGNESHVKKEEYEENYPGLAVENIEQPLNLISAEIDENASREIDDKTVEGRVGSPRDNEREAEMTKEETVQEKNIKSLSQESIAQDPVKNNQNDDNSPEKSNTEIFEESKAAGSESIEHETNHNETSETIALSLVKEVESLEIEGKNIVARASTEEKMEDGSLVKVVEDNNNNTRPEEDNKDSDMEESKIVDTFAPEMNQTDESLGSALQASLAREQECLESVILTSPEPLPMDEKDESGSIKTDEENKRQNEKEKLTGEEDLEQILQKTEAVENLEQPSTVLSAKTEVGALSEVAKNLEEEIVDVHQNKEKEPEMAKEEDGAKEHIIYEQVIVKNFHNDEINFETCNKEICMDPMTNKTCQSIPIEMSQNNESHNAYLPLAPMQEEESLQGNRKKKEGDDNNTEFSEVINNSDKNKNIELELQKNEPEELEKSSNMFTADTEAGMLHGKANNIIIIKEVEAIQNAAENLEKNKNEEGNEYIRSEVKKIQTTKDLKPDAETSDINIGVESELLEAKSVKSEREAEIIEKTHGLDSVEKLECKHTSENTEEEIKEEIKEVHSDIATACSSEPTKKDTTVEQLTSRDISPQSTGEETALIYREDKEEKPNMEMQELELSGIVKKTEKQVPEEVNILRGQSTEPATVIADDMTVVMSQKEIKGFDLESTEQIVARGYEVVKEDNRQLESSNPETHDKEPINGGTKETTLDSVDIGALRDDASNLVEKRCHESSAEAHEAEENVKHELQNEALIAGSNDQNKVIISDTASGKIFDVNLMECAKMSSKDSELITNEESQLIDESSAECPTSGNIEIAQISQATDMHDEDKIKIKEGVSELDSVDTGIESRSYQSEDLHQDLELHNKQIISKTEGAEVLKTEEIRDSVDQGDTCKSKISENEPSNVGAEYFKRIETINADRKEAIQEEEDSAQKHEASLEKDDAVEKEAAELEAGYQKQGLEDTETRNNGIHTEKNFGSAESNMKPASETTTRDQSNETIHETNPNTVEENRIAESVEQRSQDSQENQKEMEDKPEPKLEIEDKAEEAENADQTIMAAISTEKVCAEVEKHDDDEIVKHFNKEENGIKEFHIISIEDGGIDEVKESNPVSIEYLKATDSNEETEIESSEVQVVQTLEKETSTAKINEEREVNDEDSEKILGLSANVPINVSEEIVRKEIIEDTDSCYRKMKATAVTEITAEPSLEEVLRDDKQEQDSNIPSDKSSSHADKPEASQQGSIVLEENTFVHEFISSGMEVLKAGEVREEIREYSEIENRSQASETVSGTEVARDHTLPEEIAKEHETPSLSLLGKEDNYGTKATIDSVEENLEKVIITKEEIVENSSAIKTAEDMCLQKENSRELEVSQLQLQVRESMSDNSNEEHENEETIHETGEIQKTAETASESAIEHKVADHQTLPEEKSEEQHQTESVALLSKEHELGSTTEIEKMAANIKEVELLEDEPKTNEDVCLQKEASEEFKVFQLDLELNKDTEESPKEESKVAIGTPVEITEKKEVFECKSISSLEDKGVANKDGTSSVQTNPVEKSEEQNSLLSSALLSKEQEVGMSAKIESIEENMEEREVLEDKSKVKEEVFHQNEHSRELEVSLLEFQIDKDVQNEINKREDGDMDGTEEEIKEVSELALKSSSQVYTGVAEDEITSNQPLPTEKSKEDNETLAAVLLSKDQEDGTSTTVESIKENIINVEVPKNTRKTVEEASMQKGKSRELYPSQLELQLDTDTQESPEEVHNEAEGTLDEPLKLQHQHDHEMGDAACSQESRKISKITGPFEKTSNLKTQTNKEASKSMSEVQGHQVLIETEETGIKEEHLEAATKALMAEENQSEKTTNAIENMHDDVINEQISTEKGTVENLYQAVVNNISSEDATTEIHQGHEMKSEESVGDKVSVKEIKNEAVCKETENVSTSEIIEKQINIEKGRVESLHQAIVDNISCEEATKEIHQEHEIKDEEILGDKMLAREIQPEEISIGKGTIQSLHQDVVDKLSSEQVTKEIHQDHEIKDEEILGDKILAKEIQPEVISAEKETDENLYQVVENENVTEHFPGETGGENLDKAGSRMNIKNQGDDTIFGDSRTEATIATEKDLVVETSQKVGATHPAETTLGIHQEDKNFDGTLENQIPREVEPEKLISTGKRDAPHVQQEPIILATQVTEAEGSQLAYATIVTPEVKRLEHGAEDIVDEREGKAIHKTTSKDSAKISLFDMMHRSTRERQVARELTEEKGKMTSKEEMEVEKQTEKQMEKAKSDEEVGEEEEEDEQKKNDSGSDAPVIVEASRDIEIKVVHKKSHNILSGVGSKVKHSISKVKKAITGKSSHPKQHSPQ